MAELKTLENDASVDNFLKAVMPDRRREDALIVKGIMEELTGLPGKMWGDSIVGFGQYHYKYESGREGDWFRIGFSPRKASLSLYIIPGFKQYADLLVQLGKHKTSVSCLYITNLKNVDIDILSQIIRESIVHMDEKYP